MQLQARTTFLNRCRPSARSRTVVVPKATAYVAPSQSTAANELQLLRSVSSVQVDSIAAENVLSTGGGAVSFGLLMRAVRSEALGLRPIENAIAAARAYSTDPERQVEKAMANVGALVAGQVTGRISTEVDPRYANDAAKMVAKAKSLVALYKEVGVPASRLLMRIPATWAGVQACKELEKAGIACHIYMVYSVGQAAAAAEAGASIVNANCARTRDFYDKNPGLIRDPKGPRQDAGGSPVDPGVLLVTNIYNYCKVHHPKSLVMATGIRTREDALALAGCDVLVLPPKVAAQMAATATTAGYNDGLHAAASAEEVLDAQLTPRGAADAAPTKMGPFKDEASFQDALGVAGTQLLTAALKDAVRDVEALASMSKATTGVSST
uniref:Transaldolase n=1 Tax=Chlamydomonas leiostraca TaxID=1034604 RepID=A0A7S0S3P8_9CHLO